MVRDRVGLRVRDSAQWARTTMVEITAHTVSQRLTLSFAHDTTRHDTRHDTDTTRHTTHDTTRHHTRHDTDTTRHTTRHRHHTTHDTTRHTTRHDTIQFCARDISVDALFDEMTLYGTNTGLLYGALQRHNGTPLMLTSSIAPLSPLL
jgi:hypothetical protein